ncbi:MAG: diacylglycerol kinase family lipid kinase [Chloroflexota bacterium]|nr:MAG: diacylglycerol kinase family lipid kinase [Chloroflexota bacterium]
MPNTLLVYNPVAGRYPSRMLTERAAEVLKRYGWEVEIETTSGGEHIHSLAIQAVEEEKDALIVVGGDGSLNKALPGLVGTETALGVLPAGTANVWAQQIGLPGLRLTRLKALEESAHRLAKGQIKRMDVGLSNDKHFLLWSGIGIDAFIVHRIEPRKQWEKNFTVMRYAASAVWSASQWQGINLRVETDDLNIEGNFLLAEVSNIRLYAGGYATLSPQASLDDGLMELWLFDGESLEEVLQQAWSIWSGRHVSSKRVQFRQFKKVTLESDSPIFLQMDGEPEIGGRQVSISVIPRGLKVLIPEGAPEELFQAN